MAYGTTQRRSESDMPATKSKRPVRRFESLGDQMNSQEASQRFQEANWRLKRPAGGFGRPDRWSKVHYEGLRGQLEG